MTRLILCLALLVGCPPAEPDEVEAGEPTPEPTPTPHPYDDDCEYMSCPCDLYPEDEYEFDTAVFWFDMDVEPAVDGVADVTATFRTDYQRGNSHEDVCRQVVQVKGTARTGRDLVPGCAYCGGLLEFDPASALDISAPEEPGNDCPPEFFEAAGGSLGMALLAEPGTEPAHIPGEDGGLNYGDFLRIALIPRSTLEELEFDGGLSDAYDLTVAAEDVIAEDLWGSRYVHGGFIRGGPDDQTLSSRSGLEQVAAPAEPDSPWFYYFRIMRPHQEPTIDGRSLRGHYYGEATWVINFGG